MSTYTPTAAVLTPFDIPDDGDDVSAASVNVGLAAIADAAKDAQERSRPLASFATLRAVTGQVAGSVRLVDFYGFYQFMPAVGGAESLPWIVAPTVGTGRWVHILLNIQGEANGLAQLGPDRKLLHNGVIDTAHSFLTGAINGAAFTNATGTYADVAGLTLSFNAVCNQSDVIIVNVALPFDITSGAGAYARMVITDGATVTYPPQSELLATGTISHQSMTVRHVVSTVGTGTTVSAKIQIKTGGAGTATVRYPSSMTATLTRP